MINALTRYKTVSTIWSIASDLLKDRGSSVSEMKPKYATWATSWVRWFRSEDHAPTVSEDDIRHCQESLPEAHCAGRFNGKVVFGLDTRSDHGDHRGHEDTRKC